MKTIAFLILCFTLTAGQLFAQPSYETGLIQYQKTYKNDLADIIQSDTSLVRFFKINPEYKVTATVQKLNGEKFFNMSTSDGGGKQAIKYAVVSFLLYGKQYKLYAYQLSNLLNSTEYKENFFIPFTDLTSGIGSYGGGRYIDFVVSDIKADNLLVIDFNKAYNPYCAFRTGYSCPIPPAENNLGVQIKAGERDFDKK